MTGAGWDKPMMKGTNINISESDSEKCEAASRNDRGDPEAREVRKAKSDESVLPSKY